MSGICCAVRTCFAVANEVLANEGLSDDSNAAAEKTMELESLVALVATVGRPTYSFSEDSTNL
jgi:hypothetical protein